MGYMRHHAIVVTGYEDRIKPAYAEAQARFLMQGFSQASPRPVNGYQSFLRLPTAVRKGGPN